MKTKLNLLAIGKFFYNFGFDKKPGNQLLAKKASNFWLMLAKIAPAHERTRTSKERLNKE